MKIESEIEKELNLIEEQVHKEKIQYNTWYEFYSKIDDTTAEAKARQKIRELEEEKNNAKM
jgi:hypothetical protein